MKTLKAWDDSPKTFEEFVSVGDEIDTSMYDYFLGIMPPRTMENHGFLMGEPATHNRAGETLYMTFLQSYVDGKAICHYAGHQTVKTFREVK